ncbi:MAG: hypothetical protein HFE36_03995 [Clostridia bacterium]|nr:hypothetical protein [Clostridia bacterium]
MRRIFSIAMLIVGTVIGAGFCSGREIVSFFGSGVSIVVAPVCGVSIFFVCMLFLSIGSRIGEKSFDKINSVLLGKYHFAADIFLLVNNLIVLSAMIAGLNSLLKPFVPFPVFGAAAAVLCAVIASKGVSGMLDCNFIVVPVIIAVLAAVCFASFGTEVMDASLGMFRMRIFPIAAMYVSMNMMLASTVLTTLGKLTRKQIVLSSAIAAASITALLALIITALNCTGNYSAEMPILEISAGAGKWLYVLLAAVTGISIFTTMLTAVGGLVGYLGGKAGGKVFNSAVVVIAGTVTSFLGFTRVVSLFYPLVGVVGLIYIVMCVKFVCKAVKPRKKIFGKGVQSVDKSSTGGGILNT